MHNMPIDVQLIVTIQSLENVGASGTKFFSRLTGGKTVYEVFALRGEGGIHRYTQFHTISHNVLKKHKMIQKKYLCCVYAVFRHVSSDFRSNVNCCKHIH